MPFLAFSEAEPDSFHRRPPPEPGGFLRLLEAQRRTPGPVPKTDPKTPRPPPAQSAKKKGHASSSTSWALPRVGNWAPWPVFQMRRWGRGCAARTEPRAPFP
ncbi:hypothetical protein, conserved [Angomonas deanei]|uniref:Uncharacterized protein n=1 Tax=Angomonas deanei TaxID=59799 RepID=A0A7G2C2C2_9TRYP|nr:hypothetical protein, conserved [Angomonas deanei]